MSGKPPSKQADIEARKERLKEHHKILVAAEFESAKAFDQAILTLAGGALGISFTFVERLSPASAGSAVTLGWAWALFVLSLISTLISFLVSQSALRREQEVIDEMIDGNSSAYQARNIYSTITLWLNIQSAALFIAGATLLGRFVYVNLKG